MSYIDNKIIKLIHKNIIENGEFPKFGSPETKCNKCMFYNTACFPRPEYVGCYSGWKKEIN